MEGHQPFRDTGLATKTIASGAVLPTAQRERAEARQVSRCARVGDLRALYIYIYMYVHPLCQQPGLLGVANAEIVTFLSTFPPP